MKPASRLLLAAVPGAAVAIASLLGWAPAARDMLSYFVPLRARTAAVLAGTRAPFWNPDVGCGEPFFANPQSALLYPPAWLAAALPPTTAVGVEAGLHLVVLGVGCALLARRLGARGWLDLAAGVSVVVAGPVADAAGVLNNLDALAWMPLAWWAALERRTAATALFVAASFLAGEPQLAVIAGLVAITLAPRRRTFAALALALGLAGVQAVPFLAWVRGGDRGRVEEGAGELSGTVLPAEVAAVAAPGALPPRRIGGGFVTHFAVPLWALVAGVLALGDRRPGVRALAWWGVALVSLAVVPGFPAGLRLWNAITAGLVRFPGRLLFPAVVAAVPAAAAAVGVRRAPRWAAVLVGGGAAAFGLALGGNPWAVALGAASAGAVVAPVVAAPAALLGAAAVAPFAVGALDLARTAPLPPPPCAAAQRGSGRTYVVAPSWEQVGWVEGGRMPRVVGLGWGYTPLLDGRRMARTFAPLESRALQAHLGEADRGPAGRWWLDALGADRVVAQHPVAGLPLLCRSDGLAVFANPEAWPEAAVVCGVPRPGEAPRACGEVLGQDGGDDAVHWRVRATTGGGVLLWLSTPDPGWRMRVDGRPATAVTGAGILHGVAVPAGEHEVDATYRPSGLTGGLVVSLVSACLLGGVAWRRW